MTDREAVLAELRQADGELSFEEIRLLSRVDTSHLRAVLHRLVAEGKVEARPAPKWEQAETLYLIKEGSP